MGVCARFVANHRHTTEGVCARHVVGEVGVKKLYGQRAAVRGCFCGVGPIVKILKGPNWTRVSFEDLGVRACFGPLPDGIGSVVDPHPATDGVSGELLEPVSRRRISALDPGNIDRVLFAHQGIRAPLTVGSQVDIFELITIEALVSTSIRALEDAEG